MKTIHRAALAVGALAAAPLACAEPVAQGEKNVPELTPAFAGQTRAPEAPSGVELNVEELASGLAHPWGVDLLPDGAMLVTERPGALRVVAPTAASPRRSTACPRWPPAVRAACST